MPFPRFQFTIRRLVVLIAICALCLAALRDYSAPLLTIAGFLVVCFGIVFPGFFISRARGGSGIIGGALSASAISAVLVNLLPPFSSASPSLSERISSIVIGGFVVGLFAFILGLLFSGGLYLIIEVIGIMLHPEQQLESPEKISQRPRMTANQTPAKLSDLACVSDKTDGSSVNENDGSKTRL
jgi:Na+/proline symporter